MRTARIFISSTFSDFVAERDILHERVFPRLERLCADHGCSFQAVDLRWGVSEQDGEDYTTLDICLAEVRRCQHLTPRPNFILLAGDRYGWRPLPTTIAGELAERLLAAAGPNERETILASYAWDENAVPRELRLCHPDEQACRRALRAVASRLDLTSDERALLLASATHRELMERLALQEFPESAVCAIRTLENVSDAQRGTYLDLLPDGSPDAEANTGAQELKETIRQLAPRAFAYTLDLAAPAAGQAEVLETFAEAVYQQLSEYLKREFAQAQDGRGDEAEAHEAYARQQHERFAPRESLTGELLAPMEAQVGERAAEASDRPVAASGSSDESRPAPGSSKPKRRGFFARLFGRGKETPAQQGPSSGKAPAAQKGPAHAAEEPAPLAALVLTGAGGCGMTQLVAELFFRLRERLAVPSIVRFVGLTGASTDSARLLAGLGTHQEAAVVLVDGLDGVDKPKQLLDALFVTKRQRPVVLSMSDACYERCKGHLPAGTRRVAVPPLTPEEASALVEAHLRVQHRRVTEEQRAALMDAFRRTNDAHFLAELTARAARLASYEGAQVLRAADTRRAFLAASFAGLTREQHFGPQLVGSLAGHLLASRSGLSDKELFGLLDADDLVWEEFERTSQQAVPDRSRGLPYAYVSRAFYALLPLLTEHWSEGEVVYQLSSRETREVVREQLGRPDEHRFHEAIADYFLARRTDFLKEVLRQALVTASGSNEPMASRFAFELPYQLVVCERFEELYRLLCNRAFFCFMHGWDLSSYVALWNVVEVRCGHTPCEGFAEVLERAQTVVDAGGRLADDDLMLATYLSDLLGIRGGNAEVLSLLSRAIIGTTEEGSQSAIQASYLQVQSLLDGGSTTEALQLSERLYHQSDLSVSHVSCDVLYGYGQALYRSDRYAEAEQVFRRYHAMAQLLGVRQHIFTSLKWIASCEKALGHFDEALELYERLEDEYGEDGELDELIPIYFEVATTSFLRDGDLERAEHYYDKSEELCLSLGNHTWLMTIYQQELSMLALARRHKRMLEVYPRYLKEFVVARPGKPLDLNCLDNYLKAAHMLVLQKDPDAPDSLRVLRTIENIAFMERCGNITAEALQAEELGCEAPALFWVGWQFAMEQLPDCLQAYVRSRPADATLFGEPMTETWRRIYPRLRMSNREEACAAAQGGSADVAPQQLELAAYEASFCMSQTYTIFDLAQERGGRDLNSYMYSFSIEIYNEMIINSERLKRGVSYHEWRHRSIDYHRSMEELYKKYEALVTTDYEAEDEHVRKGVEELRRRFGDGS